jgi:glutaminase
MTMEAIEEAQSHARRGVVGRLVALIEILERVHAEFAPVTAGEVATYIPELARADPSRFGIAVATIDGQVFEVGDAAMPFTIQSISKPLVFGIALEARGNAVVLDRVGVEPSGNPFNSIEVEATRNRPFNPMVNAGAIVTTGLIGDGDQGDRSITSVRCSAGSRPRARDRRARSSNRTPDRRSKPALAWLMRSFGKLDGDVDEIVDLYFGQCSVLVTARDLAVIGATLPTTGGTDHGQEDSRSTMWPTCSAS